MQSLGVTAIYLNPIFEARSNHRYDTADFKVIDPMLGTLEDFQTLVAEAKKRGMVLILDGVFNHMSSDSPAFDRYGRYDEDRRVRKPGLTLPAVVFLRPAQRANSRPCAWITRRARRITPPGPGFDSIPKLNSDVRRRAPVRLTWGGTAWSIPGGSEGIGGWRLDVGGDIDAGGPASDYWEGFRVAVRNANPEGVIIGEEWGNASKWLLGSEWDSVMNYRLRRGDSGVCAR